LSDEYSKWSQACADAVWPIVSEALGGGEIKVEGGLFDRCCDIDAVQMNHVGSRSLSLRVQWDNPMWGKEFHTFTVRYKNKSGRPTEHDKILAALDSGTMLSSIRIHCYTSRPRGRGFVKRIAVAWTLDLGRYYRLLGYDDIKKVRKEDGKELGAILWHRMINDIGAYHILVWLDGTEPDQPCLKPYCQRWIDEFTLGAATESDVTVKA